MSWKETDLLAHAARLGRVDWEALTQLWTGVTAKDKERFSAATLLAMAVVGRAAVGSVDELGTSVRCLIRVLRPRGGRPGIGELEEARNMYPEERWRIVRGLPEAQCLLEALMQQWDEFLAVRAALEAHE